MKTLPVTITATLLLLVQAAPVLASEPESRVERLSLDQCVTRAVANSHTLEAERHRLAALDAELKELYWTPFSNVFVEGVYTMVPDRCIDKDRLKADGVVLRCGDEDPDLLDEDNYKDQNWGPKLSFKAGFGVPVYTFGKVTHGVEAMRSAQKAKEAEYPRFLHTVRFQVAQAYNAVAGAREMLYTIEKGSEYLGKARKKIEADLEAQEGTSTQIDLIKLQVLEGEVAQYKAMALEIERVGLAALRMLVRGDEKRPIDIEDKPQEMDPRELLTLAAYKDAALGQRPELKALGYAVDALEAKVALRRSEFWPDLILTVGAWGSRTPGRTDIGNWVLNDDYNTGPGFGFTLSLKYKFDIGVDIYRLKQAKAELAAITTDKRAALDGIMLDVEKAFHHAAATGDTVAALQKSKKLVKGWISAVLQNHAIGLASAKDVKDALEQYFKVMASLHKATHDYNVAMADLDRATGAPVQGRSK